MTLIFLTIQRYVEIHCMPFMSYFLLKMGNLRHLS